jgi:two-component system cell cycle sensor histidine kinase/response regulator CckA
MGSNGAPTVLLVDDEFVVRKSLAAALERSGYSVVVAHGGVEGLHRFAQNRDKIQLIIADIVMPDLDGLSMVKVIRRENPQIKVLFITGHKDKVPGWAEESCELLLKPFGANKLVAAVAECLNAGDKNSTIPG